MGFNLGISSINPPQTPSPSLASGGGLIDVRVRDIVLDDSHPRFQEVGEWLGIGTIFYDSTSIGGELTSPGLEHFARPYFSNIKFYPLINEIVTILRVIDPLNPADGENPKITYYLPPANIWNHPHHNALPDNNVPNPFSRKKSYEEVEAGSPNREYPIPTPLLLGASFKERRKVFPLYAYEGDHIFEGRWGNTIRLGSTVKSYKFPNPWSQEGSEGDPLTILRIANPNALAAEADWIPTVEDTSSDLSSIYLTSTQKIPFSPSTFKVTSFKGNDQRPSPASEYQGNQIIIDSGRLLLNSKVGSISLCSPNVIHLSSGDSINLDSGDKVVLSSSQIYLASRDAKERAVLGDKLVQELLNLLPSLEKLANACEVATAGPYPVAILQSAGSPLVKALGNLKSSLKGENPSILSNKVKLQ